jgi:hypothetical protein
VSALHNTLYTLYTPYTLDATRTHTHTTQERTNHALGPVSAGEIENLGLDVGHSLYENRSGRCQSATVSGQCGVRTRTSVLNV